MLKTIQVGRWLLEVDKEQTAAAYQNLPLISEECTCAYCLNFVSAYAHFPPTTKDFFEQFGIDPLKEGEVYQLYQYQNEGELIYVYAGFYHFVGRILQAPNLTTHEPNKPELNFRVLGDFEVNFNTNIELIPANFPSPIIQLDFFSLNLPLVI